MKDRLGSSDQGYAEIFAQIREIARRHGTYTFVVSELWNGGVKLEDLDIVMDIKDSLTIEVGRQTYDSSRQISADSVSAKALYQAYKAVDGDLEVLEILADRVIEKAGDRRPYPGLYTSLLNRFVDEIMKGKSPLLD